MKAREEDDETLKRRELKGEKCRERSSKFERINFGENENGGNFMKGGLVEVCMYAVKMPKMSEVFFTYYTKL